MKILTLDIETAPNTAYVWGLWKQNIAVSQIKESGYILSWAAKWLHEKELRSSSLWKNTPEKMLRPIHNLLSEADSVVHYNGTKFDIPWLNGEFAKIHLAPPAPYHQIDLLRVVRNQFKFPSNKLEFVAKALGVGAKSDIMTFEDWVGCIEGDAQSWRKMDHYNRKDVELTEELYLRLLPWIKQHPNHGLYKIEKKICPSCGSDHYHSRGTMTTRAGVYQRYQCQNCGTWFRGNKNEISPAKEMHRVAYS